MCPTINTAIDQYAIINHSSTILSYIKYQIQQAPISLRQNEEQCDDSPELIFKLVMIQSSFEVAPRSIEQPTNTSQKASLSSLQKETAALQVQASNLLEQQAKQRSISEQIEMLQTESQEAYETLRRMTQQYNQKYSIYNSKLDNRIEDIRDERDRIESNVYYIEQQNQVFDQECKRKVAERVKLREEIDTYTLKRQRLASLLVQEGNELGRLVKANKAIEDSIKSTRQEYQLYQEQIFEVDMKGQNLKKYGFEVVPQKIMSLLETKDQMLRQIDELQQQKKQQSKKLSRLANAEEVEYVKQEMQQERTKKNEVDKLLISNFALKEENEKLGQIKYAFQWNPNLQIKQLELNLQDEEKRIAAIQKEISTIKRKGAQITQRIKQYLELTETEEIVLDVPAVQQVQSPKKSKQKPPKKEKSKKPPRRPLFDQINNDLESINAKKESAPQPANNIIAINETTYKVKKPSQKLGVFIIWAILIGCVYWFQKTQKK